MGGVPSVWVGNKKPNQSARLTGGPSKHLGAQSGTGTEPAIGFLHHAARSYFQIHLVHPSQHILSPLQEAEGWAPCWKKDFPLCSGRFVASGVTFRFMIYFSLVFGQGTRYRLRVCFVFVFADSVKLFQHHSLKENPNYLCFTEWPLSTLMENQLTRHVWSVSWIYSASSHLYVSPFFSNMSFLKIEV